MLLSLVLLGFTRFPPVLGMLLFSLSLSLGPVGLVSSVPIILPLSLVGTGMGLVKSSTNIGASIFDITTGLLQDADPHKGYSGVVLFFIAITCLAILAAITLCILDCTLYHGLLNRSAREAVLDMENKVTDQPPKLEKVPANWVYGGIYLLLACTCWVLFCVFVLF